MNLVQTIEKSAGRARWVGIFMILPVSGVWAIGTLVGVRLLMSGFSLMAIGSTVKGIANRVAEA